MPGKFTPADLEQLTRKRGGEMFERIRGSQPWIIQKQWWQERLLEQCMADEWFKVQSFRFVDALPRLQEPDELARHLKEYFVLPGQAKRNGRGHRGHGGGANGRADALQELEAPQSPWLVRTISYWLNFHRYDSFWAHLCAESARRSALIMAGSFIAGSNVEEAERAIRRMRNQQLAFTIDVLGEAALSRQEADEYHQTYLDLIRELPKHAAAWPKVPLVDEADGQAIPRVNVSVKLTSIHPGFDPIAPEAAKRRAKEVLRPLLRLGMENGAHIHIDMEHYAIKDLTLDLCEELFLEDEFRDYPHFGIVLQAYLRDGDRDAARTVEYCKQRGTPIWVRLVKGAYWDSETVWADQAHWPWPVWEQKWQSDACYERMTRVLLENHEHVSSAFASHNVRSLTHAIALRELLGVPGTAFELQMLYGMGDPIKRAAVEMGQRARIYTPYGPLLSGMAYFIRRLLENTANESFLRLAADTPEEELLRDPEETGRRTPPFERPPTFRFEFEEPLMDPFENTANTDFAKADNRARMVSGLAEVKAGLGREIPLVINGEAVTTGAWAERPNPSRPKEIVARVAQADEAAVQRAVQAATDAFAEWRHQPAAERAEYLFNLGRAIEQRRHVLAAMMTIECGKPWREADAEVSEAIDYCNYYGKEMLRLTEHVRHREMPGETNVYYYAPRGVTAVIAPWNFPLALSVNMIAAALVTGNTVVFKPASPACATGYEIMRLADEIELPPGVLNFLPGAGDVVGDALARHPGVATVAFTGSRDVGLRVHRLAAEAPTRRPGLKKVIAQLGAKNAIIVDSDADLDEAIKGVIQSAFGYAGQKCSAASRVIVVEPAHNRFMERLVETARSLAVGPAEEPATSIPALIDEAAAESVRKYIALGKQEATCALEADAQAATAEYGGYYVGPVIFDDVPPQARIAQEEIFGPVLCVLRAGDIEEAIEIFNASDYALAGGIYSRSPRNIARARASCECGNFYINRKITGSQVDLQPFGGIKLSGMGAVTGGPDYLIQYCEPRTITENTIRRGFAPSERVLETLGS